MTGGYDDGERKSRLNCIMLNGSMMDYVACTRTEANTVKCIRSQWLEQIMWNDNENKTMTTTTMAAITATTSSQNVVHTENILFANHNSTHIT